MTDNLLSAHISTMSNVWRALTDEKLKKNLKKSFSHTNTSFTLRNVYSHLWSMERTHRFNQFCLNSSHATLTKFLNERVTISNKVYWREVHNFDGPVIFVTPHYGPFSIGCLKAILDMGATRTINAFYDPPQKNSTNAIYKDVLGSLGSGFNPIFNDKRGLVSAIKRLKNNEIVTMMPDVFDLSGQSISVPFFGHFASAMAGTAFLTLKTNALVLQAYCVPTASGGVHCLLDEPFRYVQTNDFEQDIFELTSILFKSIEQQIRKAPEHWVYLRQLNERLGLPLPQNQGFENSRGKISAVANSLNIDTNYISNVIQAYSKNEFL
ncbi:lysophospholipid acyltransferase family protein [Alteromonas macleodii]|uniref:lysophospholipid acyltransferase family protein n=1 Tax=Alteromonas macleodii TaxID=28108 RepID=UPI002FE2CC09